MTAPARPTAGHLAAPRAEGTGRAVPGAVRIFLSAWLVYLLFLNPYPASLASNMLDLGVSLVDRQSVELGLFRVREGDVSFRDGRYLSGLPPGGSIPAAIIYGLLRLLVPPFTDVAELTTLNILATALVSAPLSALSVSLLYGLLGRLGFPETVRVATAALFAFGTMHFGFATIYAKEPIVAFILLAVFSAGSAEDARRRWTAARSVGAGLLLAYAIATVYAAVIQIAVLGAYLAVRLKPRQLLLLGATLAVGLVPLLAYHQIAYGSLFAHSYTYRGFEDPRYLYAPDPRRFLEIMFSPADGLLVYTPVLALGVIGAARAFRAGIWRAEIGCIAGIVIATWFFYACYRLPLPGRYVLPSEAHFATRYMHVVMPFALIPVGLAMRWVPVYVVRALGGASVFFAYLAVQAGLIPQFEWRIVYAVKVWATTFGTGLLFAQFLPERFGVETLNTVLRRPEVGLSDLLGGPASALVRLAGAQLLFAGLFLAAAALVGTVLWRLWRSVLRPRGLVAPCAGSAAS